MTQIFPIVDSHCHLDFPDFEGEVSDIVKRANEAGVTRMITICTKLRTEPNVRAIADAHDCVFYAAGTHPMSVEKEPMVSLDDLLQITKHPKMVGIGETGLDYHYSQSSSHLQKQSLRIHIEAARRSKLPLIIHSRAADQDMAKILREEFKNGAYNCVMHCFSSSAELAKAALDLGFYLSMSGITTFKKSHELRDIFASAPLDRLLVETDSPYLAPTPYRGKRNEPAYSVHTAKIGASIFNIDYSEFALKTSENFDRLFTKATVWNKPHG